MTPERHSPAAPSEAGDIFGDRLPLAEQYAEFLATAGIERGLIGPRESARLWNRHLNNCAALAELIPRDASVIDVGSGAGLPGLVLAIVRPDLDVSLLEPMQRRVDFLTEAVAVLGLINAAPLRGRAEELAGKRQADAVVSRAIAPLNKLLPWCLPLLAPGGAILAMKGSSAQDELIGARPLLRRRGISQSRVVLCGSHLLDTPTTVIELKR